MGRSMLRPYTYWECFWGRADACSTLHFFGKLSWNSR
jgi:hypothetical protein